MARKIEVLKITIEDVLRILGEKGKSVSLAQIEKEVNASHKNIIEAIKELMEKHLIKRDEDFYELTDRGRRLTEGVLKKHLICENYFKQTRDEAEAHQIANIIEHYISHEVINNIEKLLTFREKSIPLTKAQFSREGVITDIILSDYALFERLVSMGICLGERIKVMYDIPDAIVVNINAKNFAMGKEIAEKIEVFL